MFVPTASEYLRALNARGLLQADRRGPCVLYRLKADPAVPHAGELLGAFEVAARSGRGRKEDAFAALTAFTHPRRIALLRALDQGPLGLSAIRRKTGISERAAVRHLRKLEKRGCVAKRGTEFCMAHPKTPLAAVLMDLARRGD